MIAVFGLYPFAHVNDSLIGVRCALAISSSFRVKIGITTGTVYAGTVGSSRRCEYAVIGDSVNMAARLMSFSIKQANSIVDVVCDEESYREASSAIKFQKLPLLV